MAETRRCGYCRRPLPPPGSVGRPAEYCRRSHRQRAYEARRRAAQAALADGQVVVAQADLDRLHDRLYVLEAALDDVTADVGAAGTGLAASRASGASTGAGEGGSVSAGELRTALAHLREAAEDLRGFVVEPQRS